MRRFSSAHAIALLALFIALGSGAWAATQAAKNSVTSKSVRNGTLTGTDVKNDSLTGKDVKESTLGLVPSAQSAQTAQSAASAQSFAGIKKIDYQDNQTGQTQTILSFRGLSLTANCQLVTGNTTALKLDAQTTPAATVNSSLIYAFGPGANPDGSLRQSESPVVRGAALGAGGTMTVIPLPGSTDGLGDNGSGAGLFAQTEGQIVYRSDTDVVTVTLHTFMDFRGSGSGFCEAYGNAVAQ